MVRCIAPGTSSPQWPSNEMAAHAAETRCTPVPRQHLRRKVQHPPAAPMRVRTTSALLQGAGWLARSRPQGPTLPSLSSEGGPTLPQGACSLCSLQLPRRARGSKRQGHQAFTGTRVAELRRTHLLTPSSWPRPPIDSFKS
ncbi:hypothetical protein NDU88_000054 [Pleurodeles waltl]|uniref:Uncharacterized protein n=1 Tax=Pleurodeles waltl TaxID=8319 RepID=A0AAV7TE07_PLEWA|nr:hypothetical protein NDU88_000054 [Pleurodeles waltl]